MNLISHFIKSYEWERYPDVFKEVRRRNRRPKKAFLLDINTIEDVERVRNTGVPIFAIDTRDLAILGYPMRIPTTVAVPREHKDAVRTGFRIHTFQSLVPFARRRIEDVIVFVMSMDLIAARAIIERNKDLLDFEYLQKRILQEELEEAATRIHLQEFICIPVVAEPLPKDALLRATRGNFVRGMIP
jgi:hypothetical protein